MKAIDRIFMIFAFWVLCGTYAFANMPDLKPRAYVDSDVITMGDLFEGLEEHHDLWVADAPAPGARKAIMASSLVSLSRQYGIYWDNSRKLRQVIVFREGDQVPTKDLKNIIKDRLDQYSANTSNRDVTFYNKGSKIFLPKGYSTQDISLDQFQYDQQSGRFTATLEIPIGNDRSKKTTLKGQTVDIISIPTLARNVQPGQPISRADIRWINVQANRISRNVLRSPDEIIGLTPKRNLKTLAAVRGSDLERPSLVKKGKLVKIVYNAGKISLTTVGRALENGGQGDSIRVMNISSKKTMDTIVSGAGEVSVISANTDLAFLNR